MLPTAAPESLLTARDSARTTGPALLILVVDDTVATAEN
jgi:hypothetical protein